MCLYTYHNYPACGHIANWTVSSCKEYTNTLRLLSHGGLSGYCNHIQTTHDLLSEFEPDSCGQCDFELQHAVHQQNHNSFRWKTYQTIEGLNSAAPIIELSVRMKLNPVDEEEEDYLSPIPQEYRGCDCYSCTASPVSSGVSLNNMTPSKGSMAEEENTADLWKALRQGTSSRDISLSSTQVGARRSRNSLHDVVSTSIERASHPLKRLNTSNSYSWTSFDLSDMSPVEIESQNPYGNSINSSSFYSDTEPEQSFFDLSDDSFYFDYESEVEDPNSLTFLDDDSDADDESGGGCDLPDKFDEEYVDMSSHLISPLVSDNTNAPLLPVRDSAPVVDQPATPMLCPAPLRVQKLPRFLSLNSIVEDLLIGETLGEDGPDVLLDKNSSKLFDL